MSELSVVIPTFNRRSTLARALAKLEQQTLEDHRFEVVVVDDGSDDGTEAVVRRAQERAAFEMRYLRHDNRGPGFTQNRGIREARSPVVLLLADDALATSGALEEHLRMHELHPERYVALAGKMVQAPDLPDNAFLRHWDPWESELLEPLEELQYIYFWGCNVSFKRAFVLDHDMFVERRGAAMEDVELGYRLSRDGGMRLLYGKEALCHHFHPETIQTACRRAYERGLNFDVLTESVDDPLLFGRLRLLGQPHYVPPQRRLSGDDAPASPLYGDDQAKRWEAWRMNPLRRGLFHAAFNRATVPGVWLPLIRAAERYRLFASLVGPRAIYCTVMYFINQGIEEMRRRSDHDASETAR